MVKGTGTIGFINSSIAWGGGEKWHLEVAGSLFKAGHPVVVIAHPNGELVKRSREIGIPTEEIALGNLSFLNPSTVSSLVDLFRRHTVKTLILNLSRDMKSGGMAGRIAKVDRIIYRRGSATPVRNTWLNRRLYRKYVDDILVNSEATAASVLKNNPNLFPKDKITVIPNGINTEKFATTPHKLYYQKQDDEFVMVSLGRLEFEKNHAFLVEVANELKLQGMKFRILIGGEGNEYKRIEARRVELNLHEEVILAGFIEDPHPFLYSGDLFLMPSLWEGFGYVLAEAGACALPTVGFSEGSIPEVIEHGKTGFLTKTGNLREFVDRVMELANNPELRIQMGQAARERVQAMYSMTEVDRRIRMYLGLD